jgi:hypothetical protein
MENQAQFTCLYMTGKMTDGNMSNMTSDNNYIDDGKNDTDDYSSRQ